jgi:hypothetical protein
MDHDIHQTQMVARLVSVEPAGIKLFGDGQVS